MNPALRVGGMLLALLLAPVAAADEAIIEVRSAEAFPEAMMRVQEAIADQGYVVTRVQRVDYGLERRGFHDTGPYRIVFYGRPGEVERLAGRHPELIPFLPLKITLHQAPGTDGTVVLAVDPAQLAGLYPDPELAPTFSRWRHDLDAILADVAAR